MDVEPWTVLGWFLVVASLPMVVMSIIVIAVTAVSLLEGARQSRRQKRLARQRADRYAASIEAMPQQSASRFDLNRHQMRHERLMTDEDHREGRE